jgi:tRNA 5-methylaminomethyl-2-thiouridine biosynthesis bifunctional protein
VQGPARCAIIGAGLAGASVAHALATRGWQVTVLDSHPNPAGGASGLPVGLVVPHVSADDSPRSRMSRSGTRLMLQHARQLLAEGKEWAPSGVRELAESSSSDLWHPMAGWIKPGCLVRAWLRHPGIRFAGPAVVTALHCHEGLWTLQDDAGHTLAIAEHVVLANGFGCQTLLQTLASVNNLAPDVLAKTAAMQEVHGTLSIGKCPEGSATMADWPATPVNGNGSFIPSVPDETGLQWYAGSTFENDRAVATDLPAQHLANQLRLKALLPHVERMLASAFEAGAVETWTGTRCVTHDRLPLVGPLQANAVNSLWICAGMGARGLSFSGLCAELLVAQMQGEPLPIEASLAKGLSAQRVRRKRSSNQTF